MSFHIEKILIVGGGTAGWISALFFERILNNYGRVCEITLIESESVGIIGVGESTVHSIVKFLANLDLDEGELLACCDGSFKLAIKFVNWLNDNDSFWHPFFQSIPHLQYYHLFDIWLYQKLSGINVPDFSYYFPNPHLCERNFAPFLDTDSMSFQGKVPYAYHLNTDKLGNYLKKIALQRGVKHLTDPVGITNVIRDEQGFISSVETSVHGSLSADFFVDCTGFPGLLINEVYQEPFNYYSDSLINDSAVSVRLPEDGYPNGMKPYTTATAMKNGWIWDIPLYSRREIGYVYSSSFISGDEVERELMEDYLGLKVGYLEPNHIKMRVGKTRNLWVKNCLAVGLSGGFIEPLESTGIQLIHEGLTLLYHNFPDKRFNPLIIKNYNRMMSDFYESIKEFIILHYILSQRSDTEYWKYSRYNLKVPARLKEEMELYKESRLTFYSHSNLALKAFPHNSYLAVFSGMGFLPNKPSVPLMYDNPEFIFQKIQNEYQKNIQNNQLLKELPYVHDFLTRVYSRYSYGESAL